jgi:predicted phage terminase large subunit-like protein
MVDLVFESTTDSIDTVNYMKKRLKGVKIINTISVTRAKTIRIAPLEPLFEIGNVHVLKGGWNDKWVKGLEQFDGSESTHDEMVDNLSTGYEYLVGKPNLKRGSRW